MMNAITRRRKRDGRYQNRLVKTKYQIGDKVRVEVPSEKGGRHRRQNGVIVDRKVIDSERSFFDVFYIIDLTSGVSDELLRAMNQREAFLFDGRWIECPESRIVEAYTHYESEG